MCNILFTHPLTCSLLTVMPIYIRTLLISFFVLFFFQAEDGIRDYKVTGVQTCALPIFSKSKGAGSLDIKTATSRMHTLFGRTKGRGDPTHISARVEGKLERLGGRTESDSAIPGRGPIILKRSPLHREYQFAWYWFFTVHDNSILERHAGP